MLRWKKNRILPITILLGLLLAGCARQRAEWPYFVEIGGVRLDVEAAVTREETSTGLMNRNSLDADRGMLFAYRQDQSLPFWMKNTRIPLSIAFVDGERVIRDIQDMQAWSEERHYSKTPFRYAIEVNQGWFREHGIAPGAAVKFSSGLEEYLRTHSAE